MREQRRRRAGHRLMGAEEREDEGEDAMMSAEEFTAQVKSFAYLLDKTESSLDKAVRGHLVFKDRILAMGTRMRQYLLFGFQSRGLGYTQTSHYVHILASTYPVLVHLITRQPL